jgi:hypothetical protein
MPSRSGCDSRREAGRPERSTNSLGRQSQLPVVADLHRPTLSMPLMEYVVDEHMIRMLLEKARLYPVRTAAHGDETCDTFGKPRVVTKRGEEPSPGGKRLSDPQGELVDIRLSSQVSQRVAHAEDDIGLLALQEESREFEEVTNDRLDTQVGSERS